MILTMKYLSIPVSNSHVCTVVEMTKAKTQLRQYRRRYKAKTSLNQNIKRKLEKNSAENQIYIIKCFFHSISKKDLFTCSVVKILNCFILNEEELK